MPRKYITDLTAEELRERFSYDPRTGVFRRRDSGRIAGGKTAKHYAGLTINYRHYLAHRLAWLYVHGIWPANQIDHIDGDTRNNAIGNLREATDIENHQNTKCRGFFFSGSKGRYRAQITINKRRIYLGTHDTPEAARASYEEASARYFGEFSGVHRGMK